MATDGDLQRRCRACSLCAGALSIGLVFDRGYVAFHIRGLSGVVADIIYQFLGEQNDDVYATGDKQHPTLVKLYYMRATGLDSLELAETRFPKRIQTPMRTA